MSKKSRQPRAGRVGQTPSSRQRSANNPRGIARLRHLSTGAYWLIGLVVVAGLIGGSLLMGGNSSNGSTGASTSTVPNGVSASTLPVGSAAPGFSGTDVLTGKTIDTSTLKGQNVLYFFSSGTTCQACMVQAQSLQQDSSLFAKAHMTLVMVTNDSASSLIAGAHAYKLTLPMLADPTGSLTTRFGAVGGGMNMGANMADHSFILVDQTGTVVFHQDFPGMWITPAALINKLPKVA